MNGRFSGRVTWRRDGRGLTAAVWADGLRPKRNAAVQSNVSAVQSNVSAVQSNVSAVRTSGTASLG